MNNDDINKHVNKAIQDQNNAPLDDFDGLSPNQMEQLLYHPFEGNTVVKFAPEAQNGLFAECPAFLIAMELLTLMSQDGGIKLSSKGYLPLKLVKSLYQKDYFPDEDIEEGEIELRSEYDWLLLFVVKQLILISELAENKNNTLSLTKKGSELLAAKSDYKIYLELLKAFCLGFSWASNDGFESEEIGQVGFMYVLYLLKKYGGSPREVTFYGEKYFRAFPTLFVADDNEDWEDDEDMENDLDKESLLEDEPDTQEDADDEAEREEDRLYCFEVRFFERFCRWFDLAKVEEDVILPEGDLSFETFERAGEVRKSEVLERIMKKDN